MSETRSSLGRWRHRGAAVALLVVVGVGCVADLGTLGGSSSGATDINDRGVVVGIANRPDESRHAFRRASGGPMVDLGGSFETSRADAVNEHGAVVGSATRPGGRAQTVLWAPDGSAQVLEIGVSSYATDIADDGTIVGGAIVEDDEGARAYVRDPITGAVEFLPLGTTAAAVNADGAIVGVACTAPSVCGAALWEAGTHRLVFLPGLDGRPGGEARDINDAGEVVGTASGRAVLWRAGTHEPVTVGPPPPASTLVLALDDRGRAVGSTDGQAFLWDPATGRTTLLGSLRRGESSTALAINDRDVAAGSSMTGEPPHDSESSPPFHAVTFSAPPRA